MAERNGLSRRRLLGASAGAGVLAALRMPTARAVAGQRASGGVAVRTTEALVFVNGRIHTMDGNNTIANTVSIRNGRFSAVGGAVPARGPGIRVIDLRGRTAVPGIIDNHNHIVLMGNRPGYHTPLENASSIADVQETVLSATDFQQEIQGYEAAHAEFAITDLRWVIAHAPFITEPWVNRLKALGGGLSLTGWRYLAGTPEQNGPPFRIIVDNGIHVGMSSDGMQIAPMNPWLHVYYATTGLNARQVLINAGQQVTRQEVLKLYTANNGWFLREEDQIGTIEAGKLADLVVLSDDYFTVPDEKVKKIRSVLTVVGGTIVHDAGVL